MHYICILLTVACISIKPCIIVYLHPGPHTLHFNYITCIWHFPHITFRSWTLIILRISPSVCIHITLAHFASKSNGLIYLHLGPEVPFLHANIISGLAVRSLHILLYCILVPNAFRTMFICITCIILGFAFKPSHFGILHLSPKHI